ncbi:MAG: NADH-quinone oxidoreductase subunit B family protein [Sulfurimonas sp.]|uniref:NADH-quinone oxidoreductase subunit B family protein n=1 Tax=Sulfurimonas sp. TaxID=2022749 RepID=UPI0026115FA3|nr:NADH-quinone oxidoreductase subunit B family protein [Sulfurimonas sp.]MCW8894337.1 NADH-quinone oxidoreductase subunit B family protein [Sulfurimonas sp.]MCW8954240.1 NADH-quinone oxidoreductase subunit B family protein [Sulfurimonas sp.]MCW9066840.1 NADH-quinone oxidoreductase subunit B family protein [Sulfurimonas sp.]
MFDFKPIRKKSPWILHYNAGSCNGCDIEILACLSPKYDIERFGVINTGNPKQSDVFLVTGPVTFRSRERLIELYTQMPEPKVVMAVGSCTCTGGVFRDMYNVENGLDRYIPVDVYVPGCASSPELIIDGLVKALEILESKTKEIEKPFKLFREASLDNTIVNRRNSALKVGEDTTDDEKN